MTAAPIYFEDAAALARWFQAHADTATEVVVGSADTVATRHGAIPSTEPRMTLSTRLILLLMCLAGGSVDAAEPWQGLRHGMTPEQVRQRFPQAQVPGEPATLAGGPFEGLRLDGIELADRPATAAFYFAHDGLVQVDATLDDRPARALGMHAFETIVRELTATHGDPRSHEWTHAPWQRRSMEWRVEGVPLRVLYTDMGEDSLVKVIWQARRPEAPPAPRLRVNQATSDR